MTSQIRGWIGLYKWWDKGHTPISMGVLTIGETDPRYFDAMEYISGEVIRIQEAIRKTT